MTAAQIFFFGPYQFIPTRQLLLRDNVAVRLGGRAVDLLAALVERPGELISKPELMACIWPTTLVDESNLKVTMSSLRRALKDDATQIRYIATISGRGYRFVAPVITNSSQEITNSRTAPEENGIALLRRAIASLLSEARYTLQAGQINAENRHPTEKHAAIPIS